MDPDFFNIVKLEVLRIAQIFYPSAMPENTILSTVATIVATKPSDIQTVIVYLCEKGFLKRVSAPITRVQALALTAAGFDEWMDSIQKDHFDVQDQNPK